MFEKFILGIKKFKQAIDKKMLCSKYRNTGASNGMCMGFAEGWGCTHEMCLKCKSYFDNK